MTWYWLLYIILFLVLVFIAVTGFMAEVGAEEDKPVCMSGRAYRNADGCLELRCMDDNDTIRQVLSSP